ncbi:MAG: thiol:disulfide interchange protein DsbD [Alteromonas naphthalenivorans]|jgi:thiol:disulfide interchange protein DsbD
MRKNLYLLFALLIPAAVQPYTISSEQKEINPTETEITLHVNLNPYEHIYEKHITLSSDNPHVKLSKWKTDHSSKDNYDKRLKTTCKSFGENFCINSVVTRTTPEAVHAKLHVTLASNQSPNPKEQTFDLKFKQSKEAVKETPSKPLEIIKEKKTTKVPSKEGATFMEVIKEYREQLKHTIAHTDSWSLRLLVAFLLGLLLSLTPCIYPMIPITVGILQSQGSKSILRNFLLSCCYALGLGTTFSIMGLIAASSGDAFGSLMVNPIFVICIVTFLLYFAGSLFGFYNLYIPRFMQNKTDVSKSGSALSIFIFGLASGSVASPCLSPGLALILTMVATMSSKILGFLLLFVFGIGISTPLIIIGTFSGSINLLPRAGMWMLEIQKVFGFMLIGMCFYYLSNVLPWYVILIGLTCFTAIIGYYYFSSAHKTTGLSNKIQNMIGVVALIITVFLCIESFQEMYYPQLNNAFEKTWMTDYNKAVTTAQKEDKMLFIDFWTPYCSICKAITATILKNPKVTQVLKDKYVILSVDASDSSVEPYKSLKSRYDTWGAPNLLVVDPNDGKELKRWQSEMYDMEIDDVVKALNLYSANTDSKGLLGILP